MGPRGPDPGERAHPPPKAGIHLPIRAPAARGGAGPRSERNARVAGTRRGGRAPTRWCARRFGAVLRGLDFRPLVASLVALRPPPVVRPPPCPSLRWSGHHERPHL